MAVVGLSPDPHGTFLNQVYLQAPLKAGFKGSVYPVNLKGGHIGKEIYWTYDEMGLILGGFIPVRGAPAEVKRLFKNMRRSK